VVFGFARSGPSQSKDLRYISDVSQVQALQASLNQSLSTTLNVYGHPTALLAEAGIPPLYITQNLQRAQLRFRALLSPCHYSTFSLETLAAFTATCAPQNTRNPHADCSMSCGDGISHSLAGVYSVSFGWPVVRTTGRQE